jgi:two-component sensor histidine kinase
MHLLMTPISMQTDSLKNLGLYFTAQSVVAVCIMLAMITIVMYSWYGLMQHSNAVLLQQKYEIDQQNLELLLLVRNKSQLIGDKDELLLEKDMLLKDKDLLLKEVNHRVKNNLQIAMSLLQSQSGYLQNKQAREAILEGQNRLQSIALIHEQLSHTDNAAEIDLVAYITELVHCLDFSINKGSYKVKISFAIDAIIMEVSQVIPIGIILNEAVTNALKYAFPGDSTGEILITLKEIAQEVEICISDNGVGLPQDFTLNSASSLGMTLMQGLADQLEGTFNVSNNKGVTIQIIFPLVMSDITIGTAFPESKST